MPNYYSRPEGLFSPHTLWADDWIWRHDHGTLSPELECLGFKTYVHISPPHPDLTCEETYISKFRYHWNAAAIEFQRLETLFLEEVRKRSVGNKRQALEDSGWASDIRPFSSVNFWIAKLDESNAESMAAPPPNRRPSLLINGLPSVQEDGPSATTTPINRLTGSNIPFAAAPAPAPRTTTTSPSSHISPQRDAARMNMFRHMRPPTFKYAWTFYHDKHGDDSNYEGRLTVLLENIVTAKPFWEAYNRFPLENLRMKDSVHFFKRGVRPVWEDPRNVRGGAWTFRVPKDRSEKTWRELLVLAVGEQFADVIQPKDDLCGLSLSVRFNSNLIQLWNRDGSATASIDGILDTVLAKISPDVRPKEGSYYYKRHSEHAGYDEALAKAKAAAESQVVSGKIEEAKVKEEEVQRLEEEERLREEEEARARGRAMTVG